METLHQYVENQSELIASAGGGINLEDNIITLLSD